MFYYHTITIKEIEYKKTDRGVVYKSGESIIAILEADVQNITNDRLKRAYGIDTKISFEIYCPYTELIQDGTIIEYEGVDYKVEKFIPWDAHAVGSIFEPYVQFVVSRIDI